MHQVRPHLVTSTIWRESLFRDMHKMEMDFFKSDYFRLVERLLLDFQCHSISTGCYLALTKFPHHMKAS